MPDAIAAASLAESELQRAPLDIVTRRGLSEVLLVRGDAQADVNRARLAWTRAAELLLKDVTNNTDPSTLAVYAAALTRLGRVTEARPIFERLDHMGYRHPDISPPKKILTAA
jgi:hypothetical protein